MRSRRFVMQFSSLLGLCGIALVIAAVRNQAGVALVVLGSSALVFATGLRRPYDSLLAWMGVMASCEGALSGLYRNVQVAIAIGSIGTLAYVVQAFWPIDRPARAAVESFRLAPVERPAGASGGHAQRARESGGLKAAPRSALWSTSRYVHRPARVLIGAGSLAAGVLMLGALSAYRANTVGVALAAVGLVMLLVAVGVRNPLGSVPAWAGFIMAATGALWGWLGGAIPLLCLISLVVIVDVYWRRDGESPRT